MPTLAIIMLVYYVAGQIFVIVRGPYTTTYTPSKAAIYIALGGLVTLAWFSLPFCAGVPVIILCLLGFYWFLHFLALFALNTKAEVGYGSIAVSTLMTAIAVIVLITSTYC